MANPEKRTRERIGSSYFLGCFGFSGKIYSQKPIVSPDGGKKKKKKKTRWFSWSKFRLKNGGIEPTPVAKAEKPNSNLKDESDKQKLVPVISRVTDRKSIPAGYKAARQETRETKTNGQEDIIPDISKSGDPLSSSKDGTCHERVSPSLRGRPDPTRPGRPGSNPTGPTWLLRSPSVPATEDPKKPSRVPRVGSGKLREGNGSRGGKFDSIVGMSIVMLTLAIMLIWGRLCAVLCTAAWCYFLRRVRNAAVVSKGNPDGTESDADPGDPDLNSEAYKRKVVLEGFLERKNRVSL